MAESHDSTANQPNSKSPLIGLALMAGIGLAAVGGLVFATWEPSVEPEFCNLDGQIQDDGSIWGRDPENGCQFGPVGVDR